MWKLLKLFYFLIWNILSVSSGDVFHIKSRISYYPDESAEYFGYSVLLSDMGLHIGAPKARSRTQSDTYPGAVFNCPLDNLDIKNITCKLLDQSGPLVDELFLKNDSWYGATLTAAADKNLLVCAPRFTEPYNENNETLNLANGACFVHTDDTNYRLPSPNESGHRVFTSDGGKKDYGEYDSSSLTYYAYSQGGISATFTENNHFLIGAPGVLQWTGNVLKYRQDPLNFVSLSSASPAYTKELNADDYFGYSVASGVFQVNGPILHVASAPRSKMGYGQVLVFEPTTDENEVWKVKAKLLGPQLGAYFGAAICTLDLNADGVSDLLVGAPNYATNQDGRLTYDQGAVFVYITRPKDSGFILEDAGSIQGSGISAARFGTAIADLGDIDGDGFNDVAVGAPWEKEGTGVVYIYRGSEQGLVKQPYQIISAKNAKGFGMSIAKGYDVDGNGLNDLAIGAYNSGTAYVYRSIPSVEVKTVIKIPDAKSLGGNITSFTAYFCITVSDMKKYSEVEIDLNATTIILDPKGEKVQDFKTVNVKSGKNETCDVKTIEINKQWNLSLPIQLDYKLTPAVNLDYLTRFPKKRARLTESSQMSFSLPIYLLSDCGDDLICSPWLEMNVEPLGKDFTYIPGSGDKLGVNIRVTNLEEAAHSVKLHVVLPCPPLRLPNSCSLQKLDMICDLPEPLNRKESVSWEIELKCQWNGTASELKITGTLEDSLYHRNISKGPSDTIFKVTPYSFYEIRGKSLPHPTVVVAKKSFEMSSDVVFSHQYEIANHGPSDLYNVNITFLLPEKVTLATNIEEAILINRTLIVSPLTIPANTSTAFRLPLRLNLADHGKLLEEQMEWSLTSTMFLNGQNGPVIEKRSKGVTTMLMVEQNAPIWPWVIGLLIGLLVLIGIIVALYKFGFFSRLNRVESPDASKAKTEAQSSSSQPLLES